MKQTGEHPRHIAIIMDGNGRWAAERNLPRFKGHEKGIAAVETVIEGCLELGIPYLTLFAFSLENWKRPKNEIDTLMRLLAQYLDEKQSMLREKQIRFNAVGRLNMLSEEIQGKIRRNIAMSKDYTKLFFTLALSYGSRTEIVDATHGVIKDFEAGRIKLPDLTEELFGKYLYTRDMPDPDLLVRTSGEQRISNFLLWQISYTEFYFVSKYWPDFTKDDLRQAVAEYNKRKRRFGRIN